MARNVRVFLYLLAVLSLGVLPPTYAISQNAPGETNPKVETSGTNENCRSGYVKGITAGRARALVGVAFAIASLVIGWRAKSRAAKTNQKTGVTAKWAIALGGISVLLSIFHLMATAGAVFGSGSGKAGAIFALVFAIIGITLASVAISQKGKNSLYENG